MVAQVSSIVGALILVGWLYWLTARVQNLLTLAETAATNAEKAAAAALRMASVAPPPTARDSAAATQSPAGPQVAPDSGSGTVLDEPPADDAAAARATPAEAAPSTAPMSAVIEAEKRAMIEREFAVHGEPHTFRFRTVGDKES